jgi:hypothetical protein
VNKMEFELGDKVVPHTKSVGTSFDLCKFKKKASEKEQNYLYVVDIEVKEGISSIYWLSEKRGDELGGLYLASDLTLYKEPVATMEFTPYAQHNLIITHPTFNLEELTLGSIVLMDKGYLRIQGVLTKIKPDKLWVTYYDPLSHDSVSVESMDVRHVVSRSQSIEIISQAIPI